MREGLRAASTAVGLEVMAEIRAAETDALAGAKGKHQPDRLAYRHGSEAGTVTLGGRRLLRPPTARPIGRRRRSRSTSRPPAPVTSARSTSSTSTSAPTPTSTTCGPSSPNPGQQEWPRSSERGHSDSGADTGSRQSEACRIPAISSSVSAIGLVFLLDPRLPATMAGIEDSARPKSEGRGTARRAHESRTFAIWLPGEVLPTGGQAWA